MSELLDLLPPGSATDGDGMLIIGGCRADDLAEEFGTPVLVVAEEALRVRAREYVAELTSRWPNTRVVFASKAFPCTAVQRVIVQEGLGLDVAGGGEILTALPRDADLGHPWMLVDHQGSADTHAPSLYDLDCSGARLVFRVRQKALHRGRHEHVGLIKDEPVG